MRKKLSFICIFTLALSFVIAWSFSSTNRFYLSGFGGDLMAAITTLNALNYKCELILDCNGSLSASTESDVEVLITPTNVGIVTLGAYDLTINKLALTGPFQWVNKNSTGSLLFGYGAVDRALTEWFGATPNGSTDNLIAINATIDAMQYGGRVQFLVGDYRFNGVIGLKTNITLEGFGVEATCLTEQSTTANGIMFDQTTSNYQQIKNLTLRCATISSGTGILADGSCVARDSRIQNVYVDGFASGIAICWGINGVIEQVRCTGQGKVISGSKGINLYESGGHNTTTFTLVRPYVSSYETDIDIDGYGHTVISPITDTADVHYISRGQISIIDPSAEAVDTGVDKVFKTVMGIMQVFGVAKCSDTLGAGIYIHTNPTVLFDFDTTGLSAPNYYGWERTRIRVYRGTSVQIVGTAIETRVEFNAESWDEQIEFDAVTNYRFTATKPRAWYTIKANIVWDTVTDLNIRIYKNTSLFSQKNACNQSEVSIDDVLQLDAGDSIEIKTIQQSGADANIQVGADKTFLNIYENF